MKTYITIALGLAWIAIAQAGGPDTVVQATSHIIENRFYCPPSNVLVKNPDTQTWSARGGWKSYELSFVDKITRFSGAQWRGTNVGQIFCVYRGELETSFPVLLAYNVLAYAPGGGRWSANLGGYQNCETPDPADCPFSIRVKPSTSDIYEQAAQMKRSAPKSTRPGF